MTTRRAFLTALTFALGILVTIGAIGVATGLAGRMLGDLGPRINYFVAAIFFVIGLHFIGVIPMPFSARTGKLGAEARPGGGLRARAGLRTCPGPVHLRLHGSHARHNPLGGQDQYGLRHRAACGLRRRPLLVIVAAGTFTEVVERYLKWTGKSRGLDILKKVCGVLVILGGVYLLWIA